MKKYKLLNTRKFLNKGFHHSDASIFASTELRNHEEPDGVYIHNYLKIRDCSQVVTLALESDNPAQFRNSISKVSILITELTKLRTAMQKAWILRGQLEAKNKKDGTKQARKKVQKVPSSTEGG